MLALWIALGILGGVLLFYVIPTFCIAVHQFKKQLVRKNKNMWTRECSWPTDPEQSEMFRRGEVWAHENADHMTDVEITNEGYRLCGEYYDFGYDKAVIITPGRMEGCHYSLYFAYPYKECGYNVLAIDNRAHGMSEGKYNCLGIKEYSDIISWGKFLHDEHGINEVVLHGICIGSAGALNAMTSERTPDYFKALIVDGMYDSFKTSFVNHVKEKGHMTFPVVGEVMLLIKLFCGVDPVKDGPINRIGKLTRPILFIHSKADPYSTPENAQLLYDKCTAPKRIAWFEGARHSHIRINYEREYDAAIAGFLADKDSL